MCARSADLNPLLLRPQDEAGESEPVDEELRVAAVDAEEDAVARGGVASAEDPVRDALCEEFKGHIGPGRTQLREHFPGA